MLEGFFAVYYFKCRGVMMAPFAKLPIVGALCRAADFILVDLQRHKPARVAPAEDASTSKPSSSAREQILAHCARPAPSLGRGAVAGAARGGVGATAGRPRRSRDASLWPPRPLVAGADPKGRPCLVLPEGTTHNGKTLLTFFTGAFAAGAPVLPVIVRAGR